MGLNILALHVSPPLRKPVWNEGQGGRMTMRQAYDMILSGGTVVNQDGAGLRDIGIREGRIAAIGALQGRDAGQRIDCTGLHILPGVIDTQVHFREPGLEHKENLETGSRAAVLGGVTAVFEMPNTKPPTTGEAALADKMRRARGRMHCDFAFWVGGTRENAGEAGALECLPAAAGIKVFMGSSTGDLLVEDDEGVAAILRNIRRRAAFHSEDEFRLRERLDLRVMGDPSSHPIWRDEEAALASTRRLVALARRTGARIHILHISTASEADFLEIHRDVASCEVTPHHLTLTADDYTRLGTLMQMNPPIRETRHRERLWAGVRQGLFDVLGSDHAPHTRAEKAADYPASPSGMPGVQTLLPVMLDHVAAGRLTLERLVDLTSHGPARLFGIACKGRIAVGYDADFTVVDLHRRETITDEGQASRAGWTPYRGMTVTGWPIGTIIRGRRVMWEGEIVTPSCGEAVRFHEALPAGKEPL
jgi:dihydroorotase